MTETTDPDMTPDDALARHLAAQLQRHAQIAAQLMPPDRVSTAFLAVAVSAGHASHGPVGLVEWLRDVADAIEAEHMGRLRN